MYKHLTRLFFTLLFICLFLPFIPQGCETGETEQTDTTAVEVPVPAIDTIIEKEAPILPDTLSMADSITSAKKDSVSNHESKVKTIVNFISSPDNENLSGIGFIIFYYNWIIFNSSLLVIVLTIIAGLFLSVKNYEKWGGQLKIIALINLVSWLLIVLVMFKPAKIGIWLGTMISLINYIVQILNRRKPIG